jgi:N-acetylmuramoyl-L-alanine amidase
MVLHPGDEVRLELKASARARVFASIEGDRRQVRLTQDAKQSVGGSYTGHLQLPLSATRPLVVHYRVVAADGSIATTTGRGTITIAARSANRVGYVVLVDRKKDIDARPYGVVESSPDGDWLFFPSAQTPFEVTGSDGAYYRVALGLKQGWIAKRSLKLAPPGTSLPQALVLGMEIRDGTRASTMIIHLTRRVPFSVSESVVGPRLRLRLYGARPTEDFLPFVGDDSNIAATHWEHRNDETTIVSIELRQHTLWGYAANWVGNDLAIAVKRPPVFAAPPASALQGLLIVVDPGHSPDAGAVGPLGTQERDVNLAIAKRLAVHLEDVGAHAVLTRFENTAVGLYDRTALAARLQADVLISVHNNALPDGANPFTNHGFAVYYYQPQSLALARAIHAAYGHDTQLMDGGTHRANFALARPTEEIAVLTESAFMIWPPEEMELREPAFQDKLARTLADGMDRWAANERSLEFAAQSGNEK